MGRDEMIDDSTSMYDSDSSEISCASEYRPHLKYGRRHGARAKRFRYQSVSNELRSKLIQQVIGENQKIKPTAKELGINYSTAKSILQIYRKEGRIDKKLFSAGDENQGEKKMEMPVLKKEIKEVVKPAQVLTERRYPLRERKSIEDKDLMELPRPKHDGIEPKTRKIVKKLSIDTAEQQSIASAETRTLEVKEEHSKPLENLEDTQLSTHVSADRLTESKSHENREGKDCLPIIPSVNHLTGKTFRSNVGFVAVKTTPKALRPDQKETFATQSWVPLIFSPNNQINPLSLINLGLCGFFKFNN